MNKEFYKGLHKAMEGLLSGDSKTQQRVEILDVGVPLHYSDFYPGATKQSARAAMENVQDVVDKVYLSDPPTNMTNSLSEAYGCVLKQLATRGVEDENIARAYMQETVPNPESVLKDAPLPRYVLYDYYRANYLHMKSVEASSIETNRQELSLRSFEDWGEKQLSVIDSDAQAAFQKWQVYGYKHEVERYLQHMELDTMAEDKHLSWLASYKSQGVRSDKDAHVTVYPHEMEPKDWYKELAVK